MNNPRAPCAAPKSAASEQRTGPRIWYLLTDPFERPIEFGARRCVSQAFDVFHYEERRLDFGDEAKKMTQKRASGIVGLSMPDFAERLAGRTAKYPGDLRAQLASDIGALDLRQVGQYQFRIRVICRVRGGKDRVAVER